MSISSSIKRKAIGLRKRGFSYSEILANIPVAKSTLSNWFHSVKLAKHQTQRLTEKRIMAQQKGAIAKRKKRIEKESRIKEDARREVTRLIRDPLWLTGVILYWAEGSKQKSWTPSIGVKFMNMDLSSHKIFIRWSKHYLNISDTDLQFEIYLHKGADSKKARKYWATNLSIPMQNIRIYYKKHNPNPHRKNTKKNYNGVFRISICKSTNLNRKIAGWTDGVINYLC